MVHRPRDSSLSKVLQLKFKQWGMKIGIVCKSLEMQKFSVSGIQHPLLPQCHQTTAVQFRPQHTQIWATFDLDYLRRHAHASFRFIWLRFYTPMTDTACVQRGCVLHGVARPGCNTCYRAGAVQPPHLCGFISCVPCIHVNPFLFRRLR